MAKTLFDEHTWNRPITNREAKEAIAGKLAAKVAPGQTIGIGSGSTCFITVRHIAALPTSQKEGTVFLCTSMEMELLSTALGLPVVSIHNRRIDWHFDGADEIDPMKQMIKGRGGAFLREKILFNYADAVFIVADQSKMVDRLCTNHPLPVEVTIDASTYVAQALVSLGATSVSLRLAEGKDGPVITENRNVILDTRWNDLSRAKNNEIVGLPGVVETGFFHRTDVEILSE